MYLRGCSWRLGSFWSSHSTLNPACRDTEPLQVPSAGGKYCRGLSGHCRIEKRWCSCALSPSALNTVWQLQGTDTTKLFLIPTTGTSPFSVQYANTLPYKAACNLLLFLQHLSIANGSSQVDASFMQTLWNIQPTCSSGSMAVGKFMTAETKIPNS